MILLRIVLSSETSNKLEKIVGNLKVSKHCVGCEGLDIKKEDPQHHPSIEITQKCNHNCIFCYSRLVKVKPGIYGDFEKSSAVTISQYGEPLLYPKTVKKCIEYVKSFGLRCDLQTNGSLLNKKLMEEFKELGLDIVMISLSSSNKETHQKITGEWNFDKIFENIKMVGKYFYTIIRAVHIPGFNDNELIELASMLNKTEVDEMMIHNLIIHKGNKDKIKYNENIGRIKDLLLLVDEIQKKAPKLNVTIKGCLLTHLKKMDGFTLEGITFNSFSDVPTIKRKYSPLPFDIVD